MLLENESFPDDTRVRNEAFALTAAGCKVTVICPSEEKYVPRDNVQGIEVYRYRAPREGDGLIGYLWEYGYSLVASFYLSVKVWLREGFDVIHAHNPPDLFVLIAMLYRIFGVRFVFDHHDLSPEMYFARFRGDGNPVVYRGLRFFEKLSCRMAHHIITTNESYKLLNHQRNGARLEDMTVVRNGPDLTHFTLKEPSADIRNRASTVIGYVGVMGVQDGLDYLLRALRHLIDDCGHTDFICVLIGDGPAVEELELLTVELQLQQHVYFAGCLWDDDLLSALSAADICVVPDPSNDYNDRSTMVKIMEYMALEKPVVAFEMTEHRASAGDAALYATPNDEHDFARKIAKLIEDPQLRRTLGEIGVTRVRRQLAWKFQALSLVAAYQNLGVCPGDNSEVQLVDHEQPTTT